jgi:hypothetical protein
MAAPKTSAQKYEHQKVRRLDGKDVKAVLYNGKHTGHGKYMAGEVDGKLIVDINGKPMQYKNIGDVVPL